MPACENLKTGRTVNLGWLASRQNEQPAVIFRDQKALADSHYPGDVTPGNAIFDIASAVVVFQYPCEFATKCVAGGLFPQRIRHCHCRRRKEHQRAPGGQIGCDEIA